MRKTEKPEQVCNFYADLLVQLLQDTASRCGIRFSSFKRDIITLRSRSSSEGLGFFTRSLPSLGKALDKALSSDTHFVCPPAFEHGRQSVLPLFLGTLFEMIFTRDGDVITRWNDVSEPVPLVTILEINAVARQTEAVRAIRQISYLLYKLDGGCPKSADAAVIQSFIETEQCLPSEYDEIPHTRQEAKTLENATLLVWKALRGFDPHAIIPRHGPGAVASGERLWEKMKFSHFFPKLDEVYPYSDYFYFNFTHLCDELESLEQMDIIHTATAKVVLVPKDSRGPRLISMEPLELQWIQQGLQRSLVQMIEHPRCLASGYVNFTTQEINRELACLHSDLPDEVEPERGSFITMDMKDASDRVSLWLVRKLFPDHVYKALKACRSERTMLPDGHVVSLKKFAPMGSSVCFPVEALVFWAIAVGAILTRERPNWMKLCKTDIPEVYVYGDDIILRKEYYSLVAEAYERLHLKVNVDKCCTGRFFRESCGLDAFRLNDVTPVRIKPNIACGKLSPQQYLSTVSYVNSFKARGYSSAAQFLEDRIVRDHGPVLRSLKPHANQCAILESDWTKEQLEEYLRKHYKIRWNRRLQRSEVLTPLLVSRSKSTGDHGWSELHRLFAQQASFGCSAGDREKLEPGCYTLPHSVKMRWSWVAIESLLI